MGDYVTVDDIRRKVKKSRKAKRNSKVLFIRNSAQEFTKIWKGMPKKRYHKRYYTSHRQKWISQGVWHGVFICNLDYDRIRDENGRGSLYVTDLVFEGDYFKKVHVRIDYGYEDTGNTIEGFRIIPLNEEGMLKILSDRKVFDTFWENVSKMRTNPHVKVENSDEKRIMELMEELF